MLKSNAKRNTEKIRKLQIYLDVKHLSRCKLSLEAQLAFLAFLTSVKFRVKANKKK